MKIKVSLRSNPPLYISPSTENYLEFIPSDDHALCLGNADIKDVEDEIITIKFLFAEANTNGPVDEDLTDECSERSQSEDEDRDANIFVYQSKYQLIPQVRKDWDGNDGTEWLKGITISEVQDGPDTDDIPPEASLREQDGNELSTTEVDVELDPIPDTEDIVSQISDNDQEEEYFGDDEKEETKRPKFITPAEEIGPIPPIPNMKHEGLAPETEKNDENSFKSTEIVLNPEYLNLGENTQSFPSSPGSQIPFTTPRLTRKQSLRTKIFQTLQRKFRTPGKNVDNTPRANKKSPKENIKIVLF